MSGDERSGGWAEARAVMDSVARFLRPAQKRQLWLVSAWAGALSLLEMLVAAMVIPYVQCLGDECMAPVQAAAQAVGVAPVPLLTLALFLLITLKLAVEAGLAWRGARFAQQVQRSTVSRLMSAYLHMDWPAFRAENRAHYYRRCATTAVEAAFISRHCVVIISSGLVILCLTALVIWQNPLVSLSLIVGFALVNGASQGLIGRAQKRAALARETALQRWNVGMAEAFASFREIRAHGMERFFLSHLDRATAALSRENTRLAFLPALPRLVMDFGVVAVLLAVVSAWIFAGREVADLLPQLIFYAVVARTLLPAMMIFAATRAVLRGAMLNIDLVLEELQRADRAHVTRVGVEPVASAQARFELREVSFRHAPELPAVLDRVSLALNHPCRVALVGPSGAGKSTLMELLCGILAPQGGAVVHAWPQGAPRVSYVPQHVALLDASVRDNVVFGCDDGDPTRLAEALRLACLDGHVAGLPQGVDTPIGADGAQLSGGQRQRLALARALYRNPDLLLLDEATSGLDEATEAAVFDGLRRERPDLSVVFITHRPAQLRFADRVLRLEGGRLSEVDVAGEGVQTEPPDA